jgi:Fe-S-cluster formation regulator IscX/YfhJ
MAEEKNLDVEETAASSEEESGLNRRVITKEINRLLSSESSEDGWMSLAEVGNKLGQKFPDFDVRNFGFTKLTPFIKSLGKFEVYSVPSEKGNVKVMYVRRK